MVRTVKTLDTLSGSVATSVCSMIAYTPRAARPEKLDPTLDWVTRGMGRGKVSKVRPASAGVTKRPRTHQSGDDTDQVAAGNGRVKLKVSAASDHVQRSGKDEAH